MYLLVLMFNYILQPIPLLTSLGLVINTLDVIAAFRLCIALRQLKEHKRNHSQNQDISFTRSLITVFVAVYGGEALMGFVKINYIIWPLWLSSCPSFSSVLGPHTVLCHIPHHPRTLRDRSTRSRFSTISTTHFVTIRAPFCRHRWVHSRPPPLHHHTSHGHRQLLIRNIHLSLDSPPHTLRTSFTTVLFIYRYLYILQVIANGGIFLVNLFSFLEPQPLTVTTPPELLPYGWATTELWSTPIITTIHAILTHAQPFWAQAHTLLAGTSVEPVDPDVARTTCAILMAAMYVGRTFNKFGIPTKMNKIKTKSKTQ